MKTSKQFAIAVCVAASIFSGLSARSSAQDHPSAKSASRLDAKSADAKTQLQDASSKGFALAAKTNVSDSASIQAVLIPASLAKRIFGKEVSQNYAVVELIISNEDEKAALVVHSVFLDYSQWLLSGESGTTPTEPAHDDNIRYNKPSQVASIEARLVRGEMLDAQQWTARNWTIRSLTAVGSVAGGFAFPFSGDVAKGIAAFNGEAVPGAANLWPDGTVNQINRVTDFGFQTNKIIPKQGSDILVAFFPIDRFLTQGFKKVFLKDPAALFVSAEMLADPTTLKTFTQFVKPWASQILTQQSGETDGQFQAQALQAMRAECSTDTEMSTPECKLKGILTGISLNNIRIGLEGAMTVDVKAVPGTIYDVKFDKGNTDIDIWTKTGTDQAGTITGVYLTGTTPEVVDGNKNPYKDITITTVTDGSSDTELNFTMKIAKCIPSSSKVYFMVKKTPDQSATEKAKSGKKTTTKNDDSVASTPYEFPLPAYECPTVDEKAPDGSKSDKEEKVEKK